MDQRLVELKSGSKYLLVCRSVVTSESERLNIESHNDNGGRTQMKMEQRTSVTVPSSIKVTRYEPCGVSKVGFFQPPSGGRAGSPLLLKYFVGRAIYEVVLIDGMVVLA